MNVLFALFAKPEAQTKLKRFKIAEKKHPIFYILKLNPIKSLSQEEVVVMLSIIKNKSFVRVVLD